ncbi:MAG: hypothetical protein ACREVO_05570 [Steroidobacteraceae bacterium]
MRSFELVVAGALGGALLITSSCMPARAAAGAQQTGPRVKDGSHDFDFFFGSWVLHNRRLHSPVLSSNEWAQFDATDVARPLPGGLGNEDIYQANYPKKGFVGLTVRLYGRATGLWRIYWIDNQNSHGDVGEPNVGRWHGNVGIFDEHLMVQGKPAIDRYTWTRFGSGSKITAHFAESLSIDGGKTWKVVYANDIVRGPPMAAAAGSAADQGPIAVAGVRDGSHDFDFEYGKWRMPNHRLVTRLAGSHDWADFVSCDEGEPLPGIGDQDVYRTGYWPGFVGMTVRTYDPQSGLWRLYWFDNRFSNGVMEPPVAGKFHGNVGVFDGKDTYNGKPVIVRFVWTVNPKGSKVVAKWRQAFSPDGGKTWEVNWRNELIPDGQCRPTIPKA